MGVETPATRPVSDTRPRNLRSRVTNGSVLLANVDGRSANARRYRDLVAQLTAEFPTADVTLIRSYAAIVIQTEVLQAQIIRGEAADADVLIRLSSETRRLRAALSRRRPEARGPTLDEYLSSIERTSVNYDDEAEG